MFEEYPEAGGFVRAIREEPDEPLHRLAFADWLEERGDARAAWLRDEEIWGWVGPSLNDPVRAFLVKFASNASPPGPSVSQIIHKLGPAAVPSISWLYKRLSDDYQVSGAANAALCEIGRHAPESLLAALTETGSFSGPEIGLLLLVRVHPDGLGVLPRVLRGETRAPNPSLLVLRLLRGEVFGVNQPIPEALAEALVAALIDRLESSPWTEWADIATCFSLLGSTARHVAPLLERKLEKLRHRQEWNFTQARSTIATAIARIEEAP